MREDLAIDRDAANAARETQITGMFDLITVVGVLLAAAVLLTITAAVVRWP